VRKLLIDFLSFGHQDKLGSLSLLVLDLGSDHCTAVTMAVVPLADRGDFLAKLLTGLSGLNDRMSADDDALYKKNYSTIQQIGLSNTVDAARSKINEPKNRYRNVLGQLSYGCRCGVRSFAGQ
jgi:hypothetical protein